MSILVERVGRWEVDGRVVRIWTEQALPSHYDVMCSSNSFASCLQLAKELLELHAANAVEVIDSLGMGVVVYKDWP